MPALLIDSHYLAHRSFHVFSELEFQQENTSIIYGFLREISNLCRDFQPNNIAFAFDSKASKRLDLLPTYKLKDKTDYTDEEQAKYAIFGRQVKTLRNVILPQLGFSNVAFRPGYEADDAIAAYCASAEDEVIIVSADKDLYQLLASNIRMWSPQKKQMATLDSFRREWGIKPKLWSKVKALAGCTSDKIPGLKGVGEITAAKYFARAEISLRLLRMIKGYTSSELYERNLKLVKLPFDKTVVEEWKPQGRINPGKWNKVFARFGINRDRLPPPLILES